MLTTLTASILLMSALSTATGPKLEHERGDVCKRWFLVVHGTSPKETGGRKVWAPDTITATHFQMPLEWLGYEVKYHDINKPLPSLPLANGYLGVIVDGALKVPFEKEDEFARWLADLPRSGLKTLFLGDFPLDGPAARSLVLQAFGITGSAEKQKRIKQVSITRKDPLIMHGEKPSEGSSLDFCDLMAPPEAEVFLSAEGQDSRGATVRFDAGFIAPWGGLLLDPYISRQYSPNHVYQLFDPFAFLARLLPDQGFPIPDPTTRDGRQVLFSHIDGDGFTSLSNVSPGHTNAEVIRDEVIKKYPLPITVSVIEATTRALDEGSDSALRNDYENIARGIFALPNVQPASHTFSHPFMWIAGDDDRIHLNRAPRNLALKPEAAYPEITAQREVSEAARYVNETLLTKDKQANIVLWSGNCRPPPEALADARKAGLLTLNGGNTIISKRWPGRAGIAPRTTMMDDELQVYAPAQNEMFYTNDWRSSYLGGFANVIETFTLTSAPRRLKPVNIYYHFYSGERGDALKALKSVHEWAMSQPLHSVTAETYIRSVLDARDCQIAKLSPSHWQIQCDGHIRTFRIPAGKATPRVGLPYGVVGWTDFEGQRYVHTNGAKTVDIELMPDEQAVPSLESSTAEARITRMEAGSMELIVNDLRQSTVRLRLPGGVEQWSITVNDQPMDPALTPDRLASIATPANATIKATRHPN